MGTENTASTILNGAQLTAQADRNFANAITQGFNAIGQSYRDRSAMFQDMVKSTINLKQIEVDEWYKTENLKLQQKELQIREAAQKAEMAYKKDYLDLRANQEKKAASLGPLVSAINNEAELLTQQQKDIQKESEALNMRLTGKFFDKDKGRYVIVAAAPRKGSDEYISITNDLKRISEKGKELRDRSLRISSAASQLTAGVDPLTIKRETWPSAQVNPDGTESGPNPLLPKAGWENGIQPLEDLYNLDENGDILSGKVPQENHPSPKEEEVDAFEKFGTKPGPLRSKELMPPVVEEYDSLDQYQMIVGELIAQSDEKNPFNINIAREYESRLSQKDREQLNQDRKVTQKDAFVSIGEVLASRYGNGTYTDQEKVIERKIEMYKGQMLSLGEDPAKIDLAVRKADLAIIKFRQSKEFKDIPETESTGEDKINAIVGHLEAMAEKEYGAPAIQSPPPVGAWDASVDAEKTSNPKVFEANGSVYDENGKLSIETVDRSKNITTQKDQQIKGLRRNFEEMFGNKNPDKKNPYAVNQKYIKWLSEFDKKPAAFDIVDFNTFSYGEFASTESLDESIVKARIERRKREIAADPDRAFFFWLEQNKPDQARDVPGYMDYLSESKFVND